MAGIAFKLQRIVSNESYTSVIRGFIYAIILTSGPWLIIVTSLGTLSVYSTFIINLPSRQLFKILLVNVYFLTIMVTGTLQLFFTRIFADKMFEKQREALPNVIMCNLIAALFAVSIVSIPLLIVIDIPFDVKVLTYTFFIAITVAWVLINYVSASDSFLKFIKHYLIGAGSSLLLGYVLGYFFSFLGLYVGFILGQVYIAAILFIKTIRVFGFPAKLNVKDITSKLYYSDLLASGFLLYAGMWVDKVIMWYGPSGIQFNSILFYNPHYDDVFYLAFLLSTPIIAIFFIVIETDFYKAYYGFFSRMMRKGYWGNLEKIKIAGVKLIKCVDSSLRMLILVQTIVTLGAILLSRNILKLFNMSESVDTLLAVVIIGRFFQMMMLIVCVLLLYFDLRKESIKVYGFFFVINLVLTLVFLQAGEQFNGLGMTIASVVCFIYATRLLRFYLRNAIFYTFTKRELPYATRMERRIYLHKTGSFGRYYVKDEKPLINP
ncbi:MAG: exopolysaccharide Pel transporter PelG [Spirochaetales bacterium]|nr:exopolysaccharide Pel transporter PelG [Spirochaetales bacterium]